MRVAIGIHKEDIDSAIKTYHLNERALVTHATPTLFNCRHPQTPDEQLLLLTMKDDSIDGIYDTLKQTAKISRARRHRFVYP